MVKQYRKPHRFKKRKPIYGSRFFWLGFLILTFLFSLFYFLFFAELFRVKKISIAGLEQVSEEQLNLLGEESKFSSSPFAGAREGEENEVLFFPSLRSVIEDKLENRVLFFPTRSIFLVNLNRIKEDVLERFPGIAEIEIRRSLPSELNVSVSERKITATFCQEEKCFSLDKEGVVFEEKLVDDSSLPIIRTLIFTDKISLGKKVIEKEDLVWLLEINSQLEEDLNIPIKEFIISSKEKLIVLTQEGWELYFSLQADVKWQLTKLRALLEEKVPEEQRKDLEYIELRFGNFANPKYKD